MKKILLFFFILVNSIILSQNLKSNLSIGFNYNDNKLKTYSGVLNSTTQYQRNILSINNVLNQNISYTDKINQSELSNKLSIGISKGRHSGFFNYQTNYSLNRNLNLDHLIGFGYGQRDSIFNTKINYSYALLWQIITNQNIRNLRNSIRLKINRKIQNHTLDIEYYYQPDFFDYNDYLIYGTTKFTYKIKKMGISIIDIFNYNNYSKIKLIHSLNIGFSYEFGEE